MTLILLGSVGILGPMMSHSRRHAGTSWAAGICLAATFALVFGHSWEPLQAIGAVKAMPSVRHLLFAVFFLAILVGVGCKYLLVLQRRGMLPGRIFTLLLLCVLLDLGPTTFRHPYVSPDLSFARFGEWFQQKTMGFLERGELPNFRIFWARPSPHPNWHVAHQTVSAGVPTPEGIHPGNLRSVFEFTKPFERFVSKRLVGLNPTDALSTVADYELIAKGLRMLDVRYLLVQQTDGETRVEELDNSPIVVSARISGFPSSGRAERPIPDLADMDLAEAMPRVLAIIEETGPHSEGNSCERILLLDYAGEDDLGTNPAAVVVAHTVKNQLVEMRLQLSAPCHARLGYAYYPYLRVLVDGRPAEKLETAGRFIALRLEEGEHTITLEPYLSPLRLGLLILDVVLLVAGAVLLIVRRRPQPS